MERSKVSPSRILPEQAIESLGMMESSANNDEEEIPTESKDRETRGKQDPRKEETEDEEEARRSSKHRVNQSKKERKHESRTRSGKKVEGKARRAIDARETERTSRYDSGNNVSFPYETQSTVAPLPIPIQSARVHDLYLSLVCISVVRKSRGVRKPRTRNVYLQTQKEVQKQQREAKGER